MKMHQSLIPLCTFTLVATAWIATPSWANEYSLVAPQDLRCEGQSNPLGICAVPPRLSWKIDDSRRGAAQTAYRILAASRLDLLADGKADIWDSGKVESDQSHGVPLGSEVSSGQQVHWLVMYWDQKGEPSPWSKPAVFEMTLLTPEDWDASWIESHAIPIQNSETRRWAEFMLTQSEPSVPELETAYDNLLNQLPGPVIIGQDFALRSVPEKARLYVSAKGIYTVYINGKRVGDAEYDPALIAGNNPAPYFAAYDVTDLLHEGENQIRCLLRSRPTNHPNQGKEYISKTPPKMLLQVNGVFSGQNNVIVKTDSSWKQTSGPIVKGHFYLGEVYDARIDDPLNNQAPISSSWRPVTQSSDPVTVQPRFFEPERVTDTVTPIAVFSPAPNVWTFDLGEMITGSVKWRVPEDLPEGAVVAFRYSSELREAGSHFPGVSLYYPKESLGSEDSRLLAYHSDLGVLCALQPSTPLDPKTARLKAHSMIPCDLYVSAARENGTWRSTERTHAFRYVEVVGLTTPPKVEDLEGLMIHTDTPKVGSFDCSEDAFNQFHDLAVKTTLMNMHGFYADCWDREKWQWNGNWPKERFMFYVHDNSRINCKVTKDNAHGVRVNGMAGLWQLGGGDSVIYSGSLLYLPWTAYQFNGDIRPLQDNYDAFIKHIRTVYERKQGKGSSLVISNDVIGDWLSLPQADAGSWLAQHPEIRETWMEGVLYGAHPKSRRSFMATVIHRDMVGICARIAMTLGYHEDYEWLSTLYDQMTTAINESFYDSGGVTYGKHPDSGPWGTDIEDSFALETSVVPPEQQEAVFQTLVTGLRARNYSPITGILATQPLLSVLADFGAADEAYAMMNREEAPGIKHLMRASPDGLGEFLYDVSVLPRHVGSRCHADLAQWGYWFYYGLGGLRPDWKAPGFKHFVLAPQIPADMKYARITHQSPYGQIVSSWRKENDRVHWELVVPPNTTAAALIPAADAQSLREGDQPVTATGLTVKTGPHGTLQIYLAAGSYAFEWPFIPQEE